MAASTSAGPATTVWPAMEPIPEEGDDLTSNPSSTARTVRKREVFTSEQIDTLVSTVPKEKVPEDWVIENEVVDPQMATSYLTEGLAGPNSARGSSYTYTYETSYDQPPETVYEELDQQDNDDVRQTQKVTRVTKVTTTRSVRQIPVGSPYGDLYFDASGMPSPSPVVEVELDNPVDELGIHLTREATLNDRTAPPPAPPMGGRYQHRHQGEPGVPLAPGAPEVVSSGDGEVTLRWEEPPQRPDDGPVLGYQIEMRDFPDGEWERAHDHLLKETSCTLTSLESCGEIQLRVSAAGRGGFGPPSAASHPVNPSDHLHNGHGSAPTPGAPGRPSVIAVDGQRATIEWEGPPADAHAAPLAGYQVEYRVYGTTDWIVATDTWITETRYTVESLRPNGVYEFRVRGRNADGVGVASRGSGPTHIKPAAPTRGGGAGGRPVSERVPIPGQPQIVEFDMDWVKLEWQEASGPDIAYIVEYREVGDPQWYAASNQPLPHNCIQVEGLRPGSTYEFRVVSIMDGFSSLPSEVSEVVSLRPLWKAATSRGVPAQPEAPEYLEVDGDRIALCWQPAKSTLPVMGYDVEFRDFQQDSNWYKVNEGPIHLCKMTVGDLIIGHEYQFRVLAHNVSGCSPPSDASPPVLITARQGEAKYVEAERFGAIRLLQEEMVRESPPLPDRDDSPPPIRRNQNGNLQWRDPNLKEVIEYLAHADRDKQRNASGYLQHLTFSDNLIKEETRELGGVPKLVALLKSDDPATQKNAAACLKNLSFGRENEPNKLAVHQANGIQMLSALVQTTHDAAVKEEATAALWNLSSADELKESILGAAAEPLVQVVVIPGSGYVPAGMSTGFDQLRHLNSNSALFKNATGVLRNISAATPQARVLLRRFPHFIEALVHFLTTAVQRGQVDTPTVENVVCILRNLSYRVQEVVDPNYDPHKAHDKVNGRSKSAPSGSPKPEKKKKKTKAGKAAAADAFPSGGAILWQAHVVKLYLKLLQDAQNPETLEASAGALQNLAGCQFDASAEVRGLVRVNQGLPMLVELVKQQDDRLACSVSTLLRNLAVDTKNRELIGKYAMRELLDKLPEPGSRREANKGPSDQTISAILGILFEVVRESAQFTKDLHQAHGTEKLQHLAKSFPMYSGRVGRYATQVLYVMWQHKELQDGFKRAGLKDSDFYATGSSKRGDSATLARPIHSQGRERPKGQNRTLDDTMSSGYGAVEQQYYDDTRTARSNQPSLSRTPSGPTNHYTNGVSHQPPLPPPPPARSSNIYQDIGDAYGNNSPGGYARYAAAPTAQHYEAPPSLDGRYSMPPSPYDQPPAPYASPPYGQIERREPLYASVQKQRDRPIDDSWV